MLSNELQIVVLNWKKYAETKQCLDSIYGNGFWSRQVVLVDMESEPEVVSRLRPGYPGLEVIPVQENIGYAAGNNIGLRLALERNVPAVLLLNNDTVLAEDCLAVMMAELEREKIGAVVPKIYYAHDPERIWYAGGDIRWWRVSVQHFGFRRTDPGRWDHPRRVSFATGCALLLKTAMITQIGYLDESLFSYYEDLDYSLRIQQAGYEIQYCPRAQVWHKVGAGTNEQTYSPCYLYYQTRNRIYVFTRYRGRGYSLYAWVIHMVIYFKVRILTIFFSLRRGRWQQIQAVTDGFWDSWRRCMGRKKRWENQ